MAALSSLAPAAHAQSSNAKTTTTTATGGPRAGLADIVRRALAESPDITSRLNALRASDEGIRAANASLLPRVDLDAGIGYTRDVVTTRNPEGQSLSHHGLALSVTQMLWDGGAVRGEINRSNHERETRWFEFVDATEQVALDAARAAHDVVRYRELVVLAEDNYVQHKVMAQQMANRVQAGVGRGVDLEQAQARVALADSNLATELSNLHDVAARYLRIVGEAPPHALDLGDTFEPALPTSAREAADTSAKRSAAISAAVANLRATRDSVRVREAAYHPKVEARLRSGFGRNFDGVPDQKSDTTAQLALRWNLYAGGGDQARVRQAVHLLDQAADQRDRVCRETRQVAMIAFNDTRKLAELTTTLDRNTAAIVKARDAYRQQFDIGQRNLLDLLNAENEVFTARRAVANARADFAVSRVRTMASVQRLNAHLGIARPTDAAKEPTDWNQADDAPTRCPDTVLTESHDTRSRAELDARAAERLKALPQPAVATPAATPAPAAEVAAPASTPAATKRRRVPRASQDGAPR